MRVILTRNKTNVNGTFGVMADDKGNQLCLTCELPWYNNIADVSCIPPGIYLCTEYTSPKFPDVWMINDVPARKEILIHNGNTETNTHGCILVGDSLGEIDGLQAVLNSVATLERLKTILPDSFQLTIIDNTAQDNDYLPTN